MSYVMIQRGSANGAPLPCDGQYLKAMDFEAYGGIGEISLTPNLDEALRFEDHGALHRFYTTVPKVKKLRADGKPNRPLTAATWQIVKVDDGEDL